MKKFALFVFVALSHSALAANKSVTLSVPGMTCSACPITVKKVLANVAGVQKIEVVFDKREAVVSFDDSKTNATALIRATENAGYPATIKP